MPGLQLQPEHRFNIAVDELLGEVFDAAVLEPFLQAAPAHAVKGVTEAMASLTRRANSDTI